MRSGVEQNDEVIADGRCCGAVHHQRGTIMTAPKGVAKDRADPAHFATRSLLSMCLARPPAEAATDRGSSSGIWDRTD